MHVSYIIRVVLHTVGRLVFLATLVLLSEMGIAGHVQSASPPPQPSQDTSAQLRIVHASPDAGKIDLFLDGNRMATNLAFASATDYMKLLAGEHQFQVAPTGWNAAQSVITQNFVIERGTFYTLVATGTRKDGFSLLAFQDENTLSQGTAAKVRVYHIAPNLGPITVTASTQTLASNLNYKNASEYQELPANLYTFTYTSQEAAAQASATLKTTAQLQPGTVNSIFAIGLYHGQPALQFMLVSVTVSAPQTNQRHTTTGPGQGKSRYVLY